MATGFEAALIKPVVDALTALVRTASGKRLKATAEIALQEAVRELLLAPSDLRSPEAKIAVAKAAGIISPELILAEDMLQKHKSWAGSEPVTRPGARRVPAKKAPAKKAAAKKPAAKKPAAKKAAKKAAPAAP